MKLLLIRHADPDYAADSLTPTGWREAALLADRLENTDITKIYCSPMVLWHGLCPRTSSVTTLITEERRPGVAVFRINAMGDTAHLYAAGAEPSFAARFCETYDSDERHD